MRLLTWLTPLLLVLTGCGFCGGGSPTGSTGHSLHDFTLVPLGVTDASELEGVVPALEKWFPGLHFSLAPTEPIPEGVRREGSPSVFAELLMEHFKARGPGVVFLLDDDLSTQIYGAVYSQIDMPRGNAVVALPRMRTLVGNPQTLAATTSPEDRVRARERIEKQTVSAVGKVLGLFPCKKDPCVFRRADTILELDKANAVCERHQILLEQKLKSLVPDGGLAK